MSGGGHNGGSGEPIPQSLDAVRKAGLPVGSGGSTVSGGGAAPIQNLDAVRAAGLPTVTATAPTDFLSILKALQAKQTSPTTSAVEGAGLPTDGAAPATGYADGGIVGQGFGGPQSSPLGQMNPVPQFNTQSSYNNYASPSQGLMDYPQQGQPNQPNTLPPVQNAPSPDMGGMSPSNNMGYDNSGSDAGIGGQPVNQMQTPLQGQPPSMSQYMSPQGLQIQGNPTSMPVQRQQQR
jgi:hypothetical protein